MVAVSGEYEAERTLISVTIMFSLRFFAHSFFTACSISGFQFADLANSSRCVRSACFCSSTFSNHQYFNWIWWYSLVECWLIFIRARNLPGHHLFCSLSLHCVPELILADCLWCFARGVLGIGRWACSVSCRLYTYTCHLVGL